jgi:hypothetical protein
MNWDRKWSWPNKGLTKALKASQDSRRTDRIRNASLEQHCSVRYNRHVSVGSEVLATVVMSSEYIVSIFRVEE